MTRFDEPKYVHTNGIRMAYYEEGTGMPVVFCHGFPELAYSWRHQVPAVAGAGYRAIAPDQRGYGRTECPSDIDAYSMLNLTGDLAGLLDALDIEKAVFCGHDWGGAVVWHMAMRHPERVAGVIGVNTPHLPRPPMDPLEIMRQTMGENMYIVFFNRVGEADKLFMEDVDRSMRFWYRRTEMTLADFDAAPEEVRNLSLEMMFRQPETEWGGQALLSPEEHNTYVDAFTRTTFTGGLNWYRNISRNWRESEGLDETIRVPCLMISAANDVVLRPEMSEEMVTLCPDLERHVIEDCGHWTQAEKPEELNTLIVDWLPRRFP